MDQAFSSDTMLVPLRKKIREKTPLLILLIWKKCVQEVIELRATYILTKELITNQEKQLWWLS